MTTKFCAFSPYSCSKRCGYGGTHRKTRRHEISKAGSGKACYGPSVETKSCFNGCCSGQFHCSNQKKCITGSYKCDYENDCGDQEDEASCQEHCFIVYTAWQLVGNAKSIANFQIPLINCGDSSHVIQTIKIELYQKSHYRYNIVCCRLNKNNMASISTKFTNWVKTTGLLSLQHQNVECDASSYVNGFGIDVNKNVVRGYLYNTVTYYLRYRYRCTVIKRKSGRFGNKCKYAYTRWWNWGDLKISNLYNHQLNCRSAFGSRWFLNDYQLEEHATFKNIRFKYYCCRMQA